MEQKYTTGCKANGETYTINGIKYIVSRSFKPTSYKHITENDTLAKCVRRFLNGTFIELTNYLAATNVEEKYVCSTAGKED